MRTLILALILLVSGPVLATETLFIHRSETFSFYAQIETGYAWENPRIKSIALEYRPGLIESLMLNKPESVDQSQIEKITVSEPVLSAANDEFNSVRVIKIATNSKTLQEIILYVNNDRPEQSTILVANHWRNVYEGQLTAENVDGKSNCASKLKLVK